MCFITVQKYHLVYSFWHMTYRLFIFLCKANIFFFFSCTLTRLHQQLYQSAALVRNGQLKSPYLNTISHVLNPVKMPQVYFTAWPCDLYPRAILCAAWLPEHTHHLRTSLKLTPFHLTASSENPNPRSNWNIKFHYQSSDGRGAEGGDDNILQIILF